MLGGVAEVVSSNPMVGHKNIFANGIDATHKEELNLRRVLH